MIMTQKVALVTGASSGIGEATALRLQAAGYLVYGAARRLDRMNSLSDNGVRVLSMDITDEASMVAGVKQILADNNRIDVLVNNAGFGSYGALEDVPMEDARYQFEVNLFGMARLTQLVLPAMREQRSGRIINISSVGGKIYGPMGGWYHATKFAVEGLSDSLRLELAPFGIQVVVVEPGAIRTEWGAIAGDNLLKTSGSGVYAKHAEKVASVLASAEKNPRLGSPPSVIAEAIIKASNTKRPRIRYAVGGGAKPILFIRRVLPDQAFDRVMKLMFGVKQ
jgi:NAD(P)-dependent dehydrogenase (short-subunit alcohol dehydrogenase family)